MGLLKAERRLAGLGGRELEGPIRNIADPQRSHKRGGAIGCILKSLSATRTAPEFVSTLDIHDRFTLFVQAEQLKQPCHVVWRKNERIGVSLDGFRSILALSHHPKFSKVSEIDQSVWIAAQHIGPITAPSSAIFGD